MNLLAWIPVEVVKGLALLLPSVWPVANLGEDRPDPIDDRVERGFLLSIRLLLLLLLRWRRPGVNVDIQRVGHMDHVLQLLDSCAIDLGIATWA